MPVVNKKTRRRNLNLGKDLDPDLEFGERWLDMASCRPRSKAVVVYFVVTARYSKCRGNIMAKDE